MNINIIDFPQYLYAEQLQVIKDIRFTKREIDIAASIVCGRSATLSAFLSISPKTISVHVSNILQKIKGNSREDIINFVERSDKYVFIQQYYQSLIIYRFFQECLIKIKGLINSKTLICHIFYSEEFFKHKSIFLEGLEKHFSQLGVISKFETKDACKLISDIKNYQDNFVIYLSYDKADITKLQNTKISLLDLSAQKSYYFYFFEILKKLCPDVNFGEVTNDFEKQYKLLRNSQTPTNINANHKQTAIYKKEKNFFHHFLNRFQSNYVISIIYTVIETVWQKANSITPTRSGSL